MRDYAAALMLWFLVAVVCVIIFYLLGFQVEDVKQVLDTWVNQF